MWESKTIGGPDDAGSLWWSGLTEDYIRVAAAGESGLENRITPARLISADEEGVFAKVLSHVSD